MCSYFHIEDGRNRQHLWHIMLYYSREGKNSTEMQKKVCAVCGEGAGTDRMCQKWFVKLRAGDSSLGRAPRPGRPGEVISDQIKTLTENNPRSARWERVDILKISTSIELLVKRKNVPFILRKKVSGLFGRPSNCTKGRARPILACHP